MTRCRTTEKLERGSVRCQTCWRYQHPRRTCELLRPTHRLTGRQRGKWVWERLDA